MKNIKGYYSWIHSLKQASIEAHIKGHKMRHLNETVGEDDAAPEPMSQGAMDLRDGGQGDPGEFNIHRHGLDLEHFKNLEQKMRAEEGGNVPSAEHMFAAYQAARRGKTDQRSGRELRPVESDLNNDGDIDGEDQALAAETMSTAINTTMQKLPHFPWAHEENSSQMEESVNQKINRFLR